MNPIPTYQMWIGIILFAIIFAIISGCSYRFDTSPKSPIWYLDPPRVDGMTIAAGYGRSKHKQLALDMAVMAAKRTAADSISSEIKSRARYSLSEGTSQNTEIAMIDSIQMRIENYKRSKVDINQVGEHFEVYVLLSVPHQFNSELIEEIE
jgi:hypothetical protein